MPYRRSARDLWILLLFSFTVPLLLLAVVAWRDYGGGFAEAERHVERSNSVVYEHTLRLFETYAFVLDEIDQYIAARPWSEIAASPEIHRYLERVELSFPQVGSLWLADGAGKGMASSRFFPMPPSDVSDRDYYQALKGGEARTISAAYPGRTTGKPAFNVARRRSAPEGAYDGSILASVYVAEFTEFFAQVVPTPGDAVSLVRADGTILARYPGPATAIRLEPDSGFMRAAAAAPSGVFRTTSQGDGVERLYAFRKLGGFPVYVLYGRSTDWILAQWRSQVLFYALFAVPSALLLALVSWLVVRKARAERVALARVAAEVERRQHAEAILQKIQRLEMLGQIAGGIAHDFNNLLMVITSNLYLAQSRGGGDGGPAAPFIDTAMQAAYRGGQLTQQLLTFSRQHTVKPEVLDLNGALTPMVDGMLKRSLRGDIAVETDLAPDAWPVKVDRAQMELAVLNLAVNARDAMPGGGTLTVRTRNVTLDGRGPGGLSGEFVALTLADTGCGIDPGIQDRVFDPFFTTKEVGKGTGLGLSQVYGFATQAGGTVGLDSRHGEGTAITLYLPRSMEGARQAAAAPVQRPHAAGGAILLVEDSPEIGRTATTLLEGFGYSVVHAENADRALEALGNGKRFDLVFSDIVMPGSMNGLDLARRVRERFPAMPVLLTTGYSNAASTAEKEGFRLLQKPYRPEVLAEAVRGLLSEKASA